MISYKAGQLAYFDTMRSGLVPVKVIEVCEPGNGRSATNGRIRFKVTADRYAYPRGWQGSAEASAVVPRAHVRRLRSMYGPRINVNYRWEASNSAAKNRGDNP